MIEWKFGGNLMYFILYLAYVLTMTITFLRNPQTFNTAKLLVFNRFSEPCRDNFKFGGNLTYFTLYLTDNLTMTNFLLYSLTFS